MTFSQNCAHLPCHALPNLSSQPVLPSSPRRPRLTELAAYMTKNGRQACWAPMVTFSISWVAATIVRTFAFTSFTAPSAAPFALLSPTLAGSGTASIPFSMRSANAALLAKAKIDGSLSLLMNNFVAPMRAISLPSLFAL